MTNSKWVKEEFKRFNQNKGQPRYRDVLIVTSFIESVIRDEASNKCKKRKDFKKSLEALGLTIDPSDEKKSTYQQNCQYKTDCLKEINEVRVQRNELLHDIIRKSLPKEYIDNTIKEMAKNIERICTKSDLIRDYFRTNSSYGFDPAELVK